MIRSIFTHDARFPIGSGLGSDAIHLDPIYSFAVALLHDDSGHTGTDLAFTPARASSSFAPRLNSTPVDWCNTSDEQVRENCRRAIDAGFTARPRSRDCRPISNHEIRTCSKRNPRRQSWFTRRRDDAKS